MVSGGAETAELHKQLSDGQRQEDLEIMKINVAGGMADIAASLGTDIDHADLSLGDAIETRYLTLWDQLTKDIVIPTTQRWRITERVRELNELGFTVEEIDLEVVTGGDKLRLETVVGKRTFHADRLRQLTGVEASEGQATQILTDLYRYQARSEASRANKTLSAIRWRLDVLGPLLERLRQINPCGDPIQGFCDFLRFRYFASRYSGRDVPNSDAFEQWLHAQQPGYPLATNDVEE